MPANKNALTRIVLLDKLLADRYHAYSIQDMTNYLEHMLPQYGQDGGVSKRCVEKDIEYLESNFPILIEFERYTVDAHSTTTDKVYKKRCIHYADPTFSIFKGKLSDEENDDLVLFMNASDEAIKLLGNDSDSLIIKAELYRERGDFKSAREILLSAYNKSNSWVVEPMLYFCNRFDKTLFLLIKDGQKIDWCQCPNFESTVKGELIGKREKIDEESDGGINENSGRTLLRILDNSPARYEISRGTEHIAEYAAYRNFHLKSVCFPSSVRSIGARAFCFCCDDSLTSVDIPQSVSTIGKGAFFCSGITEIQLPDSVKDLGDFIFSTCKKLKRIQLPKYITRIPRRTFSFCESLTHIEVPSKVKSIGERAFEGTSALKSIRFRGKVNKISPSAFKDSSIETIFVPWYLQKHYKRLLPHVRLNFKLI